MRSTDQMRASSRGLLPLIAVIALLLLLVVSLLLMFVGIPFSYHIGAPP